MVNQFFNAGLRGDRSTSRTRAFKIVQGSVHGSFALFGAAVALFACTPPQTAPPPQIPRLTLEPQTSGTTALLQAVSAVSDEVVWVSGHEGTYVRTVDGGRSWHAARVPGADTLQFRDVHAVSADSAWLMSAGDGTLSRVYRTTDGGRSWSVQLANADAPRGFFDCLSFWDAEGGLLYGDEVNGELVVLRATDGGSTWSRAAPGRLPAAQASEGGFAASGGCVFTLGSPGSDHGWIATGNGARPRVLRTTDRGLNWQWSWVPLPGGEAAGATAVVFRDRNTGVVVGGEIGRPDARGEYVARSVDGGTTWSSGGRPPFAGAIYGAAYVPGARVPVLLIVGPGGAGVSYDDGITFSSVDTLAYWSVGAASPAGAWMVGPRGRIVRIVVEVPR